AALARAVTTGWLRKLEAREQPEQTPYTVALSGGRIARTFFTEIVRQAGNSLEAGKKLFTNVHFFWADERCVPPTDPESNYAMARQFLFEPLKIPEAQIHRVRGEEPEPLALRQAISEVGSVARFDKGAGQPVFDMIFL